MNGRVRTGTTTTTFVIVAPADVCVCVRCVRCAAGGTRFGRTHDGSDIVPRAPYQLRESGPLQSPSSLPAAVATLRAVLVRAGARARVFERWRDPIPAAAAAMVIR